MVQKKSWATYGGLMENLLKFPQNIRKIGENLR